MDDTNRLNIDFSRDTTIKLIKQALERRSGKKWSVTGDRGTAWGWITITSPPKRRDEYGCMTESDRVELADLLGMDPREIPPDGEDVPAQADFREEYIDRAEGRKRLLVKGVPNWD
jgi:hypothetical protein